MKKLFIGIFAFVLILSAQQLFAERTNINANEMTGPANKFAVKSCNSILMTIDRGGYNESFNKSATYFKNAVGSSAKWAAALTAVRKPLGDCISRTNISSVYTNQLPGAPDGNYVIVQYKTIFKNKKNSIETAVVLNEDNTWKLAGYFIK